MVRSTLLRVFTGMLLCTASFALPAISADQRESGDISTRSTADGARITFKWNSQSKVAFEPETRGEKVYLHFDAPVNLKWDDALDDLHPFIKEVETKGDGKTVVLTLQCPAQAHKFLLYSKNGIDFSKNGIELTNSKKPVAPVATMQSAKEDNSIEEEDIPPVTHAIKPKKKKRAPEIAAAPAKASDKKVTATDEAMLATLAPAAGTPVAAAPTAAVSVPSATAVNAPPAKVAAVIPATVAVLAVTAAMPVTGVTGVTAATSAPAPVSNATLTSQTAQMASAEDIARLSKLSPAAGETTPPSEASTTPPAPATPAPVAAAAPPATAQPVATEPAVAQPPIVELPKANSSSLPIAAMDETQPLPITQPTAEPIKEPEIVPSVAPVEPAAAPQVQPKGETIALPLLADDPLAVFIKNKTLWIAADESAKLTEDSLKDDNKNITHEIKSIPAQNGTVLTIALDKDTGVQVAKRPDSKLELLLTPDADKPSQPLLPTLSTQNAKTSLTMEVNKPAKVIATNDPVTGEAMSIVPLPDFGSGVTLPRSFVEFSLLPTAQGIVVQQAADGVNVTLGKNAVDVTTSKGLAVSAELKQQLEELNTSPDIINATPVFFPYSRWKLDDEKKFVPMQLKLIHASLSDNAEDANNARLKLAGLFLSEGLFAEAAGMANEILRNSYKFYADHKVAALRGAANFFRYRLNEAERDFSATELEGNPETAMWLNLCRELAGKDDATFNFKDSYNSFIRYYPPVFIEKIAIIAADKAISHKEYDAATAMFTTLQKENIDEPVKKYIDFMRAKILSETGNEDEAAKIWERQADDVNDRLIRARAEFSLVNMYLKEEKIPIDDATKRLERMRIVWRGDQLELNVLSLLGNLYVEQKDYVRALRAWRDIVAYYPDVPDAITTARKMEDVFVKLYNKGGADDMPPLSALSLFYEFRDLVPTGSDGDLMIRNLAERLVKIDLLERASQLLNHQIHNRLQGTERSRVGVRLAEIYLMNRDPKQALETLKTTGYGDLTPDIQLQRIRLTAQALAQQGQLGKAIEVLSSDMSAEGNLLRLSVYWTNNDWPNVVAMAEEILSNRNDPSAVLTLQESEVLLKLATAYVYEHDSGQIQYLRDYFTPLLKNNPNKASFLFITSESGSIDYTNLSNLDKDIKTVKSFIDRSNRANSGAPAKSAPVAAAAPDAKKAVN